ncbi:hypothetical protein [Dactylosporangium sp. NPDC005555]|uniref:hypothetical protein n=1 Tax=Dactylosporangium sp. NPDC005555 TaxID=3154889 RepID=UPI0033B775F3
MSNELSPRQRELLARLFESELTVLSDAALTAGSTPESVAGVAERRLAALETDPAAADATEDTAEDPDLDRPAAGSR